MATQTFISNTARNLHANLLDLRVDIEETGQTSEYFNLFKIQDEYGVGTHTVVIRGSDLLKKGTYIYVEIIDEHQNVIPINLPPSYESYEQKLLPNRRFTFEVKETNVNGLAKMVFVGTTKEGKRVRFVRDFSINTSIDSHVMRNRGDWALDRFYEVGDVVQHSGSSYVCILTHDSAGDNAPPDPSYWKVVAQKGADGSSGISLFMEGSDGFGLTSESDSTTLQLNLYDSGNPVSGSAYRWYKDGVNLASESGSALTVSGSDFTNSAVYKGEVDYSGSTYSVSEMLYEVLSGSIAETLSIIAEGQVFTERKDGSVDPQNIVLSASLQNYSQTVSWRFKDNGTVFDTGTSTTISASVVSTHRTIQATTPNGLYDEVSLVRVKEGSDAITAFLTNEAHTVPAENDGTQPDLTGAFSDIVIYKGATEITDEYTVQAGASTTLDPSDYAISGSRVTVTGMPNDSEIFQFEATHPSHPTIFKTFTLTKSKKGETGFDAKTVRLEADSYVIAYDGDGNEIQPEQSITLSASVQNHSGTVYYEFLRGSLSKQNTTSDAYVIPDGDEPGAGDTLTYLVKTREDSPSGSVVATDSISVYGVKDGAKGKDAFTVIVTNEAHTFPAENDGTVSDYSDGGTRIIVYEGIDKLTHTTGSMGDGKYQVSVSGSSNITAGSISTNAEGEALVGAPSAMSTDQAHIVFNVEVDPANGEANQTFQKVQSFSKARKGSDGQDAPLIRLLASSQIFTFDNSTGTEQADPLDQQITFEAVKSNIAGAVTFTTSGSHSNPTLSGTGDTRTLSVAEFANNDLVKVTVQHNDTSLKDEITVYRLVSGEDALVGFLTNEAHTVVSENDGTVNAGDIAGAEGQFKVFQGINDVSDQATFSVVSSSSVELSINIDSAGSYDVTAFGSGVDTATATLRASYSGSIIDKVFSISKSKKGDVGQRGKLGVSYLYRGLYESGVTYQFVDEVSSDVVLHSGSYWYLEGDSDFSVSNEEPVSGSAYWNQFTTFEAVATDVLLAQDVTIRRTLTMGDASSEGIAYGNTGIIRSLGGIYDAGGGNFVETYDQTALETSASAQRFYEMDSASVRAIKGEFGGWELSRKTFEKLDGNGKGMVFNANDPSIKMLRSGSVVSVNIQPDAPEPTAVYLNSGSSSDIQILKENVGEVNAQYTSEYVIPESDETIEVEFEVKRDGIQTTGFNHPVAELQLYDSGAMQWVVVKTMDDGRLQVPNAIFKFLTHNSGNYTKARMKVWDEENSGNYDLLFQNIVFTQYKSGISLSDRTLTIRSSPNLVTRFGAGYNEVITTSTNVVAWTEISEKPDTQSEWATETDFDNRYLQQSQNFGDLPDIQTALGNLGLSTALQNLTTSEIQQVQNIGTTTISATQWGLVGQLDSIVSASNPVLSTSSPDFAGLSVSGNTVATQAWANSNFDNFANWQVAVLGEVATNISSGEKLEFAASGDASVSRVGNVITLTAQDSNNYLSGLSFNTTDGILTASMNGLTDRNVDLDGRYQLSADAYTGWSVRVNAEASTLIQSGETVTFASSGDASVSRVGNTITFTAQDTNSFLTGLSFNTTDGVLTATVSGQTDKTVDLDGRYQLSGDAYTGWQLQANADASTLIQSGETVIFEASGDAQVSRVGNTITYTMQDSNSYLNSLSFSGGVLTADMNNLPDRTVNLDGRYSLSGHSHSEYMPKTGGKFTGIIEFETAADSYQTREIPNSSQSYRFRHHYTTTNGDTGNKGNYLHYFGMDAGYEHDGAGNYDFYTKGAYTRALILAHHSWNGLNNLPADTPLRTNYHQQFIVSDPISASQNTRLTNANTNWIWGINTALNFVIGNNLYVEGSEITVGGSLVWHQGNVDSPADKNSGSTQVFNNTIDANNLRIGGSDVWYAGNDGAGSGMNADMVDGLHSSDLVRRDNVGNQDLNTLLTAGMYRLADSNANRPNSDFDWGNVLVVEGGADTAWQMGTGYQMEDDLYWRSDNGVGSGGFNSTWRKVWDDYLIDAPADKNSGSTQVFNNTIDANNLRINGSDVATQNYVTNGGYTINNTVTFDVAGSARNAVFSKPAGDHPNIIMTEGGTNRLFLGYEASQSHVRLWNYTSAKGVDLKNSGVLEYDGNTVWHAGNVIGGTGITVSGTSIDVDLTGGSNITVTGSLIDLDDNISIGQITNTTGHINMFSSTFRLTRSSGINYIQSGTGVGNWDELRFSEYSSSNWIFRLTSGRNGEFEGISYATDHRESSDARLKEIIGEVDPLAIARHATLYHFNKEGLDNPQIGLIAQDMEKAHPDLVDWMGHDRLGNVRTLSGYTIGSVALAGVKQLDEKLTGFVDEFAQYKIRTQMLEERVNNLESENQTLKQELNQLRNGTA